MADPGLSEPSPVAILFVDVCGSVRLYDESGDDQAFAMIEECLDTASAIAGSQGGTIVRSKGDDLLCTFPGAAEALRAAAGMLSRYRRGDVRIRAGLHYGAVIEAREDIFGDAVNLAARMLSTARPGEILATEDVVQTMSASDRSRMRSLGEQSVKGKPEPVPVYSLILDEEPATQLTEAPSTADASARHSAVGSALVLTVGEERHVLRAGTPDLIVGRSERCALVIPALTVSRAHATFSVDADRVQILDHSSSATEIRPDASVPVLLKREAYRLFGSGAIVLNPSSDDSPEPRTLHYRVRSDPVRYPG